MSSSRLSGRGELTNLDGNTCFIEQLYSEKINLILFYNTNCLGCTGRAIPYGYALSQQNKELNFIVIHVAFGSRNESVTEVKSVFTDSNPPFPIYRDKGNLYYDSFNCEGTPHWIIVNSRGEVLHSIFGSQEGSKLKIEFALEEHLS